MAPQRNKKAAFVRVFKRDQSRRTRTARRDKRRRWSATIISEEQTIPAISDNNGAIRGRAMYLPEKKFFLHMQ